MLREICIFILNTSIKQVFKKKKKKYRIVESTHLLTNGKYPVEGSIYLKNKQKEKKNIFTKIKLLK